MERCLAKKKNIADGEVCSRTNVTPSTWIPETLGCCKTSSNSFRFARSPPTTPLYALFQGFVLQNCNISMQQIGQRPATDPHISIPRRQLHGPKPLGEGQRPTPRLSVLWGLGVPDWRSRGACGVVQSWRAEVWGCEAGGRRDVLWIIMSWRTGSGGDRMKMCARLAWNESIATRSIGCKSRASPAWQIWIC
jgi:hypothetical protein